MGNNRAIGTTAGLCRPLTTATPAGGAGTGGLVAPPGLTDWVTLRSWMEVPRDLSSE